MSELAVLRDLAPLPQRPTVSVVVPVRDAADGLRASVEAVLAQVPAPHEVLLAVGPSDDDTQAVAQQLAATHDTVAVVDNPSGRTPDALSAAIAASSGEVIVRVDAHAVLPAGYLATALASLASTGAANVGGKQVPTADSGFARAVAAAMRSPVGAGGAAYRTSDRPGPADTVYLGVFRREALEAVGGYDGRFTRNQDAELNERLRRAGYLVWFDPGLAVAYTPRGSVRALASQYLQYGRWRRLTGRIHRGSLQPRQLAGPALVLGLAGSALTSVLTSSAVPIGLVGGGYALGVLVAGAVAAERPEDAVATALALATMHVSWGVGFLLGPPPGSGSSPSSPPEGHDG